MKKIAADKNYRILKEADLDDDAESACDKRWSSNSKKKEGCINCFKKCRGWHTADCRGVCIENGGLF